MTQPIKEMYAWVCDDPDTQREIPAVARVEGQMLIPLVATSKKSAQLLRVYAHSAAQARNQEIRLVRMVRCPIAQVIEVLRP